jgi:endonuclease/exonuclease/phosphatase family metal-dependent hydrolase
VASRRSQRSEERIAAREARRRKRAARKRENEVVRTTPHLALLRSPPRARPERPLAGRIVVATYNVHRWTGLNGRSRPDPARAGFVISELDADLIALQEVLRPLRGEDPLARLADALGLHVTFATTRTHRVSMLDLSIGRLEKRVAVAVQLRDGQGELDVVSTHLALADRTRHRQVRSLLDHPRMRETPTILMGDMNAWRQCRATRTLDQELTSHHNAAWPASFPAAGPMLALDRIYTSGARIVGIDVHASRAARRASDHLPVVAQVELGCEAPAPKH